MLDNETGQEPALSPPAPADLPGLLILWSGTQPTCVARPLHRRLTIGRSSDADVCLGDDTLVSRMHADVFAAAGGYVVTDRDSRHGTFVNGARIERQVSVDPGAVLRVGRTVILLGPIAEDEPRPIEVVGHYVVSAYQRRLRSDVGTAARLGANLLILGDTGTGKEDLARHYHASGPRASGPFVTHSAATLQASIAEAELFGTRRGGFTGAVDREGLLASASGGTLFLDEIGDLSLEVQSKLLRAFQEREVVAIGGGKTKKVDFLLCTATSVDVDAAFAAGRFREDLLHRIAGVTVRVDSLDRRRDEIPFLLATTPELASADVTLSAPFVEACMLRRWPGNVRGLRNALRQAIVNAAREAERRAAPVEKLELQPSHLEIPVGASAPPPAPRAATSAARDEEERALLLDALRRADDNGVEAAARLGMPKSTFYRKLEKHGIRLR
ncbi:MAG: sigma-54-dependent Fis family transcriptional regulator [Deltaproteobacteria bacterium]|nr:sigma-54-dependent Fis family transcriptional regulator [Deltaproteobacteria bacterium]